jgi:glycerol-3-phosphate dehydrogenase
VRPLPFLLPFYRGDSRPAWFVRLGLTLYDALAGAHDMPAHVGLGPREALALEPPCPRGD